MSEIDEFDLAGYDQSFGDAQEPEGGAFDELPDGLYAFTIERPELRKTKRDGTPMVSFGLTVIQGEHAGRWEWKNMVLSRDPTRMGWIKLELKLAGIVVEKASDLAREVPKSKGRTVYARITTKTKDGKAYRNVNFVVPPRTAEPAPPRHEPDDIDEIFGPADGS